MKDNSAHNQFLECSGVGLKSDKVPVALTWSSEAKTWQAKLSSRFPVELQPTEKVTGDAARLCLNFAWLLVRRNFLVDCLGNPKENRKAKFGRAKWNVESLNQTVAGLIWTLEKPLKSEYCPNTILTFFRVV